MSSCSHWRFENETSCSQVCSMASNVWAEVSDDHSYWFSSMYRNQCRYFENYYNNYMNCQCMATILKLRVNHLFKSLLSPMLKKAYQVWSKVNVLLIVISLTKMGIIQYEYAFKYKSITNIITWKSYVISMMYCKQPDVFYESMVDSPLYCIWAYTGISVLILGAILKNIND